MGWWLPLQQDLKGRHFYPGLGRSGTVESDLTLLEEGLYQTGRIKDRLDRPLGRLVSL